MKCPFLFHYNIKYKTAFKVVHTEFWNPR